MVSRFARCSFASALAGSVLIAVLAGCSSAGGSHGGASTTVTTVARPTTTAAATTTTTAAVPPNLEASPLAAAAALIQDWKKHDATAAALVATPTAVTALFATPYTNQTVVSRGCSAEFLPRVCSYGPNGGGAGPLFEIDVLPSGSQWYVSRAQVEM